MEKYKKKVNPDEQVTRAIELVRKVKELMQEEMEKHGSLDDDWELDLDKQVVEEEVIQSDEFFEVFKNVMNLYWDNLADELVCKLRQEAADEAEKERTDKRTDQSIRAETVKEIKNGKYN